MISPTAIKIAPNNVIQSLLLWSPMAITTKPAATGVAPTSNSAAPGIIAQQALTTTTKYAIPLNVNLKGAFNYSLGCDIVWLANGQRGS